MREHAPDYHGYRFPPEIVSHAVRLYRRFGLRFRDVEDLLAGRGIGVTYETDRQWCPRFGLAMLVGIGLSACLVPTMRAVRILPTDALRPGK
jgi:hypothetical protein